VTSDRNTETTDVDDADESDEVTESDDTTETTEADEAADKPAPRDGAVARSLQGVCSGLAAILLTLALVASAGVTAWLYFNDFRPNQETNASAATEALESAKDATVSLLSYSPESLDKDFTTAKSHLTGDFLSYYTQFTEQIVKPAAKDKAVKTSASVVRAAVSELHPDSAVVLVFINQTTTSKENPDGAFAASSVKVGMKKIDGTWLISAFDPV
jgi:Mce-associated membrane protein